LLTPLPAGTTVARLFPVGILCVTGRRARPQLRRASAGRLLRLAYLPARLVVGCCEGWDAPAETSGRQSSDWTCARNLTIALPWI